jgi:glycosyltransferase involved in cell wall biosynthesis
MLYVLHENPTVSILINCKNGDRAIRRCIEGALSQTYPLVDLVFQDGGSTDGTLDIVREYIRRHPGRIHLKEEPDSCAEEGFFRGLKRCKGEIIVYSCFDEELLPHAVAWGVAQLKKHPEAGAVYGDVYVTDLDGRITTEWIAKPFSLEGYLCREFDLPLPASFFRRDAILSAGLYDRDWIWGIGELEFWLRIAMKYPIVYVPALIAKYAFHHTSLSYGHFLNDEKFVSDRKAFFDRFFAEPDLPESIKGLKRDAIVGLHMFIGEVLCGLSKYPKAQTHFEKARELMHNGARLVDLSRRIVPTDMFWDFAMLRTHISAHIDNIPARRIVCYGAGNDFKNLVSLGVFNNHNVVAVVDNYRPQGDLVAGVQVIPENGLGEIAHDMVVVTSSKWAREFRSAATFRSIRNPPYIPVI